MGDADLEQYDLSEKKELPAPLPAQLHEIDYKLLNTAEFKCDLVLVVIVTLFYLLRSAFALSLLSDFSLKGTSFIDRGNIGNARIAGFQKDLGLSNMQYSLALTVTYIPYILAQLPSNLLIRRVGAKRMLPALCAAWGIISMCQGFVHNFAGLMVVRVFLGLSEGGILPGAILTLSAFYRRSRLQFRVALLFCATSLAGAFSGLLAAAIVQMDGVAGRPGWSWLFILEGLFTILFAFAAYFIMPSSIKTAWYLNEPEKLEMERALQNELAGDDVPDPFTWDQVIAAFKAPQVVFLAVTFFLDGTTSSGLGLFGPSIVNSLGFSSTRSQLLSVPPYAVSAVFSVGATFYADHYGQRGVTIIFFSLLAVAGFGLYYGTTTMPGHRWTLYGSLFLQVTGAYGTAPSLSAWQANILSPHYKRATGLAVAYTMSNAGGILSTLIFTDAPHYSKASLINLIFSCGVIVAAAANMAYLAEQNRRKAAIRAEYPGGVLPKEAYVVDDTHPAFVYKL